MFFHHHLAFYLTQSSGCGYQYLKLQKITLFLRSQQMLKFQGYICLYKTETETECRSILKPLRHSTNGEKYLRM